MAATMEINLYFCNVKSQRRHDVAALGSVFCVLHLLVNSKRIEWGSSNVPKVSAFENLTARNALSLCQISKV
jgi:hypothetical protein